MLVFVRYLPVLLFPFALSTAMAAPFITIDEIPENPSAASIDNLTECSGLVSASMADLQEFALNNNLDLQAKRLAASALDSQKLASYLSLVPSFSASASASHYPDNWSSDETRTKTL